MSAKLQAPETLPDNNDLRDILAYNIRLFRVNKGWSQEELARQCGLDRTYVSSVNANAGTSRYPILRKLRLRWKLSRINCFCRRLRDWQ